MRNVLVTGFEPYGGFATNPALDAAEALDGAEVAGCRMIGRGLPVSLARIGAALSDLSAASDPAAVCASGSLPESPPSGSSGSGSISPIRARR